MNVGNRRGTRSAGIVTAFGALAMALAGYWSPTVRGQCAPQWLYGPGQGLLGVNGGVYATAVYDDGTGPALYIGGTFTIAGHLSVSSIAKWDGTNWSPLGTGVNNSVNALAVYGGELIAGGRFTTAGGASATYIARWNGVRWATLGSGMSGGTMPGVSALTVYNSELVAAGTFNYAGGKSAKNIARWNGTTWAALGTGTNSSVSALAVHSSGLIVGGSFTTAGGGSANYIARWNGTSWAALGTGMNGQVSALTIYNSDLIAGGSFTTAGGGGASYIARWNGVSWAPLGAGMTNAVLALAVYGGELIVGGYFSPISGGTLCYIARWNGSNWTALADGLSSYVTALVVFGGELIVAGDFSAAYPGVTCSHVVRWNGTSWAPVGNGLGGLVYAWAVYDDELVAGGSFNSAGGESANYIARWNGMEWAPLGTGMGGLSVNVLADYDGQLIAGGRFSTAGGGSANYVARWNGVNWASLGTGLSGGGYSTGAYALTIYDNELIVGGNFDTAGGGSASDIARWDGTSWAPLGAGMNGTVNALAVYDGDLVGAGSFTVAGGGNANYVARWNGSTWAPLGSGMSGGAYPSIYALAVYDGELIAGGSFTTADGLSASNIARWNGTSWASLGAGVNGSVYTLVTYNGALIAGGIFTTAGGGSANRIAVWSGTDWFPMGSGAGADVRALSVYNDELIVGGYFTTAGGQPSYYWARSGCARGACCFADGHCTELFDVECAAGGGTYQGDATVCTPNPCPQPPGACCAPDGTCAVVTASACSGVFLGGGTTCSPNPCPQPLGACCFQDGHCGQLAEADCTAGGGSEWHVNTSCQPNPCPQPDVYFVDLVAPANGNGRTWATAFNHLQDALAVAESGGEIRVARGYQRPDCDAAHPIGTHDRTASFQLVDGVALRGGYAGLSLPSAPETRDLTNYETILDGDIGVWSVTTDNAYNVVLVSGVGSGTVIDGFTIRGGNANGSPSDPELRLARGGGMWIYSSSPRVQRCRFVENSAVVGGAMYNHTSSTPTISDCTFHGNQAVSDLDTYGNGGAVANAFSSHARFERCTFTENNAYCTYSQGTAGGCAGAMFIASGSNPVLIGCEFRRNVAQGPEAVGGAIAGQGASAPYIYNCVFVNNGAWGTGPGSKGWGGAVNGNDNGAYTMCNCILADNSSSRYTIATFAHEAQATMTNCTILATRQQALEIQSDAVLNLRNCVVWGYEHCLAVGYSVSNGAISVECCDIDGGAANNSAHIVWGAGNIMDEPRVTPDGRLMAGSPCIEAGNNALVPPDLADLDGDGNRTEPTPYDVDGSPRFVDDPDTPGTGVDIGASEWLDTDGDGLPDYWERKYFGSPSGANPGDDPDNDGVTNVQEFAVYASLPMAPAFYVNASSGNDLYDGRASVWQGGEVGPKRTLCAALTLATDGDTVIVAPGTYSDSADFPLELCKFGNYSINVRSSGGPTTTTLDPGTYEYVVYPDQWQSTLASLDGFTIRGFVGAWNSRLCVRQCVFPVTSSEGQCLLKFLDSTSTIANVTLVGNEGTLSQGEWFDSRITLDGPLSLSNGTLRVGNASFSGPGQIVLARGALLSVDGGTVVRTGISGQGDIVINAYARLAIEDGAVVDLSGETGGGCADPNNAPNWGTITVDGTLLVRDSTVQNTNLAVRNGDLGDYTQIYNNQINLPQEPPGWGGEFFVEGTSTIACNTIRADGDRYLDLDPDPHALRRPIIGSVATGNPNCFYVTIKQGIGLEQGELLELRTRDYDNAVGGGVSGAYELATSAGYADTWVLEQLQVGDPNHPAAKVNLTDRPGFVFQDPNITIPEALYVKEVRLYPGAVLNTGMQRLYYHSLVDENGQPLIRDPNNPSVPLANGSRIVDVPLLGFSLKVIAMEDQTEFDVRVRPRLRDPNDIQPEDPNDPNTPALEGLVQRVASSCIADPNNMVMQMLTKDPNKRSASSIAGHGAFARAGEDQIVVEFKYRLCGASDPNTVLAVYLGDSPEVGNPASADPNHYVEVARVYPPQPGRPGSIGSGNFATFHGIFPRGSLNFTRGTYVELELRGQDACVEIDDWDPQIKCTYACHDLSGDYAVSNRDYLLLLAEYGQSVPTHKGCLDSKLTADQYVDLGDVLAWDAVLSTYPPPLNLCDAEPYSGGMGTAVSPPISGLLIAGKPNGAGVQDDRLYPFNPSSGQAAGASLLPASAAEGGHYRGNGRLTRASDGKLYQLHATQGLTRLDTAARVITPGSQSFNGRMVDVGITAAGSDEYPNGVPLLDVTFSKSSPNVAYVSPVLVEPPDGPEYTYKAAAKLQLSGGTYTVTNLYGMDPRLDGCTNTSPPGPSECTLQGLREVKVDSQGNVFVLSASAQSPNNDWLVVYDESSGAERLRLLLTSLNPALRSPTALLASEFDPNHLYLASAVDDHPQTPQTHVYRCTIQRLGGAVTGVTLGQDIVINNPVLEPNNPLGYLATVTSLQESTTDGRVYVIGFTMAKVPEDLSTNDPLYQQLFADGSFLDALPTLAQVPSGSSGPITATALTGHDLALPLSAMFLGSGLAACRADTNCDGVVSFADINPFVQALGNLSAWQTAYPTCPWQNCDVNADGVVSFADINPFVAKLGSPGPCP